MAIRRQRRAKRGGRDRRARGGVVLVRARLGLEAAFSHACATLAPWRTFQFGPAPIGRGARGGRHLEPRDWVHPTMATLGLAAGRARRDNAGDRLAALISAGLEPDELFPEEANDVEFHEVGGTSTPLICPLSPDSN